MRIVTWNCQSAFGTKASVLFSHSPDIAVVQECTERAVVALQRDGYQALWFGDPLTKGLGVFCREDWQMAALQEPQYKWILPIDIHAPIPFTLLAVWACRVGNKKEDCYIGQVHRALTAHTEWFGDRPVVLAGDLNSNKIWDNERKIGNHSAVARMLSERGLVSGYHTFFGEEQGSESRPTFYLYRHANRPYHLDYVFISREWTSRLKSVEVGTHDRWSQLSDHYPVIVCPVIVQLDEQAESI